MQAKAAEGNNRKQLTFLLADFKHQVQKVQRDAIRLRLQIFQNKSMPL